MDRRIFFKFGFSALATVAAPLFARDHDDHDKKHGHGHGDDDDKGHGHGRDRRDRYFRQDDIDYLRRYYDGPRDLPPGLRKKYYRTGQLPPGWQKRMRPFPPVLIERLPPPPPYCDRGYVDGYAVVYDRRTRVIVDVIDIVNAVTGR